MVQKEREAYSPYAFSNSLIRGLSCGLSCAISSSANLRADFGITIAKSVLFFSVFSFLASFLPTLYRALPGMSIGANGKTGRKLVEPGRIYHASIIGQKLTFLYTITNIGKGKGG